MKTWGSWAALFGAAAALAAAGPAAAQNVVSPPVETAKPAEKPLPPLTPADGAAIEAALRNTREFAFPPAFLTAAADLGSPDPDRRAKAQDTLVLAAEALAFAEHGAFADPASIDSNWAMRGLYDAAAEFDKARAEGRVPAWLDSLRRRDPEYLALLAAQRRYQAIAVAGGWAPLPDNTGKGGKARFEAAASARLAKEGYHADSLAEETAEFQRRHALTPSGVIDAKTVAAMNVPVQARLATIGANLVRDRWQPDPLPSDRIVADIASAEVTLFRDGEPVLNMRAIVGDKKHLTPIFNSHVSNVVFNPAWHVPTKIAKSELYPKEARSPGYFARNDFSVIDGQLVQHAGSKSALGRVKFDMPDPFNVYLHDTPGKALFAVDSRGRSHGCVRLEKPKELALALLSAQGWDDDRIDDTIDKGDTLFVKPRQTVPVFIVYRTAEATDEGPATFRPDLYGWDNELNAILAAPR
ncbi:MAG TPA: L,D-transpeptidase family protein [Caulobacteraceae bacterium]|nr:L,D-transpeptidase family protein [Caulobacteraceae bacterium]